MKIVEYLFRKVIPLFIGAIFFFSFVIVLVDLMMNLWGFISNGVPVKTVLRIMALYVPKTVWYATPIAILFAVSYSLSDLYANNELIAIFASGISLRKFTAPLLVFSFFLSFAMFFWDDYVVVPAYTQKVALQEEVLEPNKTLNNDKIVVLSENGNVTYKAEVYDDSIKQLSYIFIVIRNEDKSFCGLIQADSAIWKDGHWNFSRGIYYKFKDDGLVPIKIDAELEKRFTEPPETFRNNVVSIETVNSRDARTYITHLQRAGLPFAEELSLYYKKFSFPFILFIVVFLSIGLSGKSRKNVMLISLALCIGSTVLFYVTQMITMLLAKFGYITPFMGAWFPVFLFVILAMCVMHFART